jgi:pimeloyl-ACP methyl ester carboxylesterase
MRKDSLVLLPGMMCDERLFQPQMAHFCDQYNVISPPIHGTQTMPDLAAAVLDAAPPKFALAGLSMGGIVAMEVMRQGGNRVTHLALMDTNPFAEIDSVKHNRNRLIKRVADGHLVAVMRDEMKPNYLVTGPHKPAILDLCLEMALDLGPDAFTRQALALRDRPDYTAILEAVNCPVLVLCGAEDRLCPPERHHAMAAMIAHAHLKIIDQAGHLPTLEQPEIVNAALGQLLEMK